MMISNQTAFRLRVCLIQQTNVIYCYVKETSHIEVFQS